MNEAVRQPDGRAGGMSAGAWRITSWALLAVWVGCAALDMAHIRAGLLTSYGADLTIPAWLYIATRSLDRPARRTLLRRMLGSSPELAGGVLLLASVASELCQWWWPHGLFPGRFDPLDIVAYATGIAVCYTLDRRMPSAPASATP